MFTPEEFQQQFNKVVANIKGDSALAKLSFEVGKIYNKAKPLGFTAQARRDMEKRGFMLSDVAHLVWEGLNDGTATAVKVPGQSNQYLVKGADNLKVAFAVFGGTVVLLTIFQDPD